MNFENTPVIRSGEMIVDTAAVDAITPCNSPWLSSGVWRDMMDWIAGTTTAPSAMTEPGRRLKRTGRRSAGSWAPHTRLRGPERMSRGYVDDSRRHSIKSEVQYRPLATTDLQDLATLVDLTRPARGEGLQIRDFSAEYYAWMYFGNPAGDAIVYGAWHDGQLVSSFALTPKRIQFDEEVVLCAKTMDMFTHPGYQGLGLMNQVTARVFGAARAQGIAMWYVTPSDRSYPIFRDRWGYVESMRVHHVVGVLDTAATLEGLIRPARLGRWVGRTVDLVRRPRRSRQYQDLVASEHPAFGPETDQLWGRCRGEGVMLVRDSTYMQWRYSDNPDHYDVLAAHDGEDGLRGLLVMKQTRRRDLRIGEIVDILCPADDVSARGFLLDSAVQWFSERDCALVQSWAIEASPWEKELRQSGVNRRRQPMAILFSPDAARSRFYDPSAWLLMPGDGNDL